MGANQGDCDVYDDYFVVDRRSRPVSRSGAANLAA
jgi:hypothetical protein